MTAARLGALPIPGGPKMLRETLCAAQTAIAAHTSGWRAHDAAQHVARLSTLISALDALRPLGPDGKHDDRHTPWCGCDDAPNVAADREPLLEPAARAVRTTREFQAGAAFGIPSGAVDSVAWAAARAVLANPETLRAAEEAAWDAGYAAAREDAEVVPPGRDIVTTNPHRACSRATEWSAAWGAAREAASVAEQAGREGYVYEVHSTAPLSLVDRPAGLVALMRQWAAPPVVGREFRDVTSTEPGEAVRTTIRARLVHDGTEVVRRG